MKKQLPPVDLFLTLPTFGSWLPISCRDIYELKPYDYYYNVSCPQDLIIPKSNGPFFFLNHPLNYVMVTGKCVDVKYKSNNDFIKTYSYTYIIDDETGASVEVTEKKNTLDNSYSQLIGKYFQVKGFVVQYFGGKLVINIRSMVELKNERGVGTAFERFLLASEETYLVRQEVLCREWKSDEKFRSSVETQDNPSRYCSLSRAPSCLQGNTKFNESINDLEIIPETQLDEDEGESMVEEVMQGNTKKKIVNISPNVSLEITSSGEIRVCGSISTRSERREPTTDERIQKLNFSRLPYKGEKIDKNKKLETEWLPLDSTYELQGKVKCALPPVSKKDGFHSKVIKAIATKFYSERSELSLKNFNKHRIENVTRRRRRRRDNHVGVTRPLPIDLYRFGAIETLKQEIKQPDSEQTRYATVDELIQHAEEKKELYSNFISVLAELYNEAIYTERTDSLLEEVESLMEKQFLTLICSSTSGIENKVEYTMTLVEFARDVVFMNRIKSSATTSTKQLKLQINDPSSLLYEPAPLSKIKNFLKTGLKQLELRGELVEIDQQSFFRPGNVLIPVITDSLKRHSEPHRIIKSVKKTFPHVKDEYIMQELRRLF